MWKTVIYIGLSITLAILIRITIGEVYLVPSNSMEGTLLKGDLIWVNKLRYGASLPNSRSEVPFIGSLFSQKPRAGDRIVLPGYEKINRNDVIVFKEPYSKNPLTFVKRCVGLPGELISLKNNKVLIGGKEQSELLFQQFSFKGNISRKLITHLRNSGISYEIRENHKNRHLFFYLTKLQEMRLKTAGMKVVEICDSDRQPSIFPSSKNNMWNDYNYGPILIPKRGMIIELNDSTLTIYGKVIAEFEEWNTSKVKAGQLYKFKRNYYFFMGDNRHDAIDSRHFGFVAENLIEGYVSTIITNKHNFRNFFIPLD